VASSIWIGYGWNSIIYLASIAGIEIELYEAAHMDGAGKLRQTWHITLPAMIPIISLMFIYSVSSILNADWQQILVLMGNNYTLYEVSDVIDLYIYRIGLLQGEYGISTAVGLLKGLLSVCLISGCNWIAKKSGQMGVW